MFFCLFICQVRIKLLNSGLIIKLVFLDILFSIWVTFVFRVVLVTAWVIFVALFQSLWLWSNQTSNISYFVSNLCSLCIVFAKYLTLNLGNFCIKISFSDKVLSMRYHFIDIFKLFFKILFIWIMLWFRNLSATICHLNIKICHQQFS